MSTETIAYVHQQSPTGLRVGVTSSGEHNLTTIVSAKLVVLLPAGQVVEWPCNVELGATATAASLFRPYQAGDLEQKGLYRFYAVLVLAAGTARTDTRQLEVLGEFD